MSCNCGYIDYHIPSCPQWKQIPLSTTTTTYTTTQCPEAEPCEEVLASDCVVYTGPDLTCFGIYNGDNATTIIGHILEQLLPNCTTTTTTSTTTTTTTVNPATCYCITFTNVCTAAVDGRGAQYTDCNGVLQYVRENGVVLPNESITVCGSDPLVGNSCFTTPITGAPCVFVPNNLYVCETLPTTTSTTTTTTEAPCNCQTYQVTNIDTRSARTFTYKSCTTGLTVAVSLAKAGSPNSSTRVCVCNEEIDAPFGFFQVLFADLGCVPATTTTTSSTTTTTTSTPPFPGCSDYTILAPGDSSGTYSFIDCDTKTLVTGTLENLNIGANDCLYIKSAVIGSVSVQTGSGLLITTGNSCATTSTTTASCSVYSLYNPEDSARNYSYRECGAFEDTEGTLLTGECVSFSAEVGSVLYEVGVEQYPGDVCSTTTTSTTSTTTTTTLAYTPVLLSNQAGAGITFGSIKLNGVELGSVGLYPTNGFTVLMNHSNGTFTVAVNVLNATMGTIVKLTGSNGIIQQQYATSGGSSLLFTFSGFLLNGVTQASIELLHT